MMIVAIGALILLLAGAMAADGATELGQDITRLGLLRCVTEFAAGTAICGLWMRWRGNRTALAGAVAVATLALGGWLAGLVSELIAVPAGFAALLLALAIGAGQRRNPLEARALVYLGEISYATYLAHFMLFVVFKLVFVSDARAIAPGLIALFLALVFIASVVLHHGVERPAQRWINALRRASSARPVPRQEGR